MCRARSRACLVATRTGFLAGARGPAASRLAAKDPGALSGGSTIVVTKPRVRVFGVPRRSNHVAALGAGASVYGGARADELAARVCGSG